MCRTIRFDWILVSLAVGCVIALPAQAALITFDDAISGATTYSFDGDGDLLDDVVFSTADPLGFNTAAPSPDQAFIDGLALEGTALLNPDLRVDFLVGAVDSITFGFTLYSFLGAFDTASIELFDDGDNSLGSATVTGGDYDLGGGAFSEYPEGEIHLSFTGEAAYGLFDFRSVGGAAPIRCLGRENLYRYHTHPQQGLVSAD